jgi:hypothetical protein
MATNINPDYSPKTPPISTERHLGSLASGSQKQFRFCMLEPIADETNGIPCGSFFTGSYDAMGVFRAKLPSQANDKIFGLVYHNIQRLLDWDETLKAFKYPKGEIVTGLNEGDVFSYTEAACNPGDKVYQRIAVDGSLDRIGSLANAAGTGLLEIPGAKFISKMSAPGQCIISVQDTF